MKEIEKELHTLEQNRDESNNEENLMKINELNVELENIYSEKVNGIMTRAKVRWLKDGEKNSKYFIGLEKRNYLNKSITRLITNDDNIITEFSDILKEQRQFYEELYAEQEVNLEDENIVGKFFMLDNNIPILSNELKELCEGIITKEECTESIKAMENFKSPGTDGLPIEFYKIMWHEVSDLLIESFNYSYQKGELSISPKQGIITLLPKKDKDVRYLKNWRPISLLNADYKILTKCLANRLKKVLPKIIHSNQSGFMKGRYIGSNIRLLFDIIDQLEEDDSPGLIFSIDFMKAFDMVNWRFLYKCLDFFNFGNSFKKWIMVLQTNISSCVVNTGWSSGFFKIGRGVRQGCPISPYLFLICSELLGIGIRHNDDIKGIKLNNTSYKLIQFADDTQILLDGTQESLNAAIALLKDYESASGMKINFDKSEIARIGSVKNHVFHTNDHIKTTVNHLNILGTKIPLNGSTDDIITLNYDPLLLKINTVLSKWTGRKLTLYGKGIIIKSLILPQIIYQLTNLVSPSKVYLENIDNKILEFIWDEKRPKINRNQIYLNYNEGGLKIPNVYAYSASLKLKWIKFLADPNFDSHWKVLFQQRNNLVNELILKSNMHRSDVKKLKIKSKFWKETLEIWAGIHCSFDENISCKSIHFQNYLWLNKRIRVNRQTVFYRQWLLKGIEYVHHLMDENGNFLNFNQFREKYEIDANFLKFYGLLNAIRNNFSVEGTISEVDQILRKLLTVKSSSQAFYYTILKNINKCLKRKCFIKWETLFDTEIEWNDVFENIYKYTNDPKLRNFQYKVLHRIFPNNKILHRMGIVNSILCSNCNAETDSLEHYLWYCNRLNNFWQMVQNWINSTFDSDIILSAQSVILGDRILSDHSINVSINFLILHAKYYVHCCRWTNNIPTLQTWIQKLKIREK